MNNIPSTTLPMGKVSHFQDAINRFLLLSLEELIGTTGVNKVIHLAKLPQADAENSTYPYKSNFGYDDLSQIQLALENTYGVQGGRGLALRTGRSLIKHSLRDVSPLLGITDIKFRLLPVPEKLLHAVEAISNLFYDFTDHRVNVVNAPKQLLWTIEHCPVCRGRAAESAICHLVVGMLQETVRWASGGKLFHVEETDCIAKGDHACTIAISKQPI